MQDEEIKTLAESLDKMLDHPSPELTDLFNALCQAELIGENLSGKAKTINKRCEALRLKMATLMEEKGLKSFKDDRGRMAIAGLPQVYASILAEKKEIAYGLLRGEWHADYAIQPSVAPSTISRLVKERLEQGLSVPADVFSYYIKKGITIRGNS